MVDKKRYSGILNWVEGNDVEMIYTKGLENIKRNTIQITKKSMSELLLMLTRDDKEFDEVVKWLEKLKKYVFESTKITKHDICITTRLSKPTYKYATKSAHVYLAEKLIKENRLNQPAEGSDSWGTRLIYIISTTIPSQQAVHIDDFDGTWDKNYYWDTQIYAPIMRILQTVWPDEDWQKYSIIETIRREKKEELIKKKEERETIRLARVAEREKRAIERAELLKQQEKAKKLRVIEKEKKAKERKELEKVREIKKKEREVLRKQREKEKIQRQKEIEKKKKEREKKQQTLKLKKK